MFLVYSNSYAGFKFGLTNAIKDTQEKLDEEYRAIPVTVSITEPADDSTVSGTVIITADAAHSIGINKVEFYIDGALEATDTSSPYSYSWDSMQYNDGSHTVKVIAYDIANQTVSDQHTITVDNTGPVVSITKPADNSTVSGTVNITALASDPYGISKVEFYIDAILKFTDTAFPYSWSWDTTQYSESTHTVKVTAYDTFNQTTSTRCTVTVDNYAPPTVSITYPVTGSTSSGTLNVIVDASGDAGIEISKVEFYINGIFKFTATSSTYSYSWDTTQYIDSTYTVKVIAYDTENQTATDQIAIIVDNVPDAGEWRIIDDDLIIVGTENNSYLMWPRLEKSSGTNVDFETGNDKILKWANGPFPEPTWDEVNKRYIYPDEKTANDYPAFKWAEDLVYKGYDDWRLPKIAELKELYDDGRSYISYNLFYCWSSDASSANDVYVVYFQNGVVYSDRDKAAPNYVRAVRESRTGGNNPPSISITNPVAGPISSGTVVVTVEAYDDYGISKVEFYIDDTLESTETSSPYSWSWDTTQGDDGPRTVKVIIYDISNQTATDQVTVSVDNTPPLVSLTYPADNSISSGTVVVTADASDDNGIIKVEFYIAGVLKSTVTSSPYEYSWDTTRSTDGLHAVKVIAYDTTRHTESETHTIEVKNWQILYDDLVKVYTGGGNYLMWPRDKDSEGCNNNATKQWKTAETSGQPVWVSTKTAYDYPSGETEDDYPAFKWAENLVYKGHSDWRLPTKDELKDLYEYGNFYITRDIWYWSSTASSTAKAYRVDFVNGTVAPDDKTHTNHVRAVRASMADEIPIVSITTPADNSTSSGTVVATVDTYDDYGISKVEFYIDDTLESSTTSFPYSWNWDTIPYSDGTKTVKVIIYDTIDQTATDQHTVTVDNTAPTVSITNPAAGSISSGTVVVIADASDTVGISKVEFYIDDTLESSTTSFPYSWNWDTTRDIDDLYALKVIAYDNINQTASTRTVTVDNWQIVDDALVKVCTSSGNYLMWPRDKTSAGCLLNGTTQWKETDTSGQPVWVSTETAYDYPSGETADHYPAFKWVEGLNYKGHTDWRLPTIDELKDLYDYGKTYISYDDNVFYWSSTEFSAPWASGVLFSEPGNVNNRYKFDGYYVRAVRDSQ